MSIQQQARGTTAGWYEANPILASAEIGYILYDSTVGADNADAGKFKIGDGVTHWNDLPIASGDVGPTGPRGTYFISSTPPSDPMVGDMWFNDTNAALSIYYDSYWVETTGQQGPTGPAPITSVSSPLSITGPASAQTISISDASATNSGVVTTGTQTIAGEKTFSSTISGSVSGNAGTVTNGVYTTGDQTIGGNKTFTDNVKIFDPSNSTNLVLSGNGNNHIVMYPGPENGSTTGRSAFFRNDGSDFYLLLSDPTTTPSATWNSKRPFYVNTTSGNTTMGHDVSVGGNLSAGGRVRGSVNKVQQIGPNISSTFTSNTAWTSLMSVTITTYGNPVLVNCSADIDFTADSWGIVRILRDDTAVWGTAGVAVDNTAVGQNLPFTLSAFDDVGAGTHTYTLQAIRQGGTATGSIGNVVSAQPVLWAWEVGA